MIITDITNKRYFINKNQVLFAKVTYPTLPNLKEDAKKGSPCILHLEFTGKTLDIMLGSHLYAYTIINTL